MAKRKYRRKIRMNGELICSPHFDRKKDADDWYDLMKKKKNFMQFGIRGGLSVESFIDYSRRWMKNRMAEHPQSTWSSDEQRLRDYILPEFGEIPIDRITGPMVKTFLQKCKQENKLSVQTAIRIRAILSKIFNDAMNDDPPRVQFNPVAGVAIEGRRIGKYKPKTLESVEESVRFIQAAKKAGPLTFIATLLFMILGLRKSEGLALQWGDFNLNTLTLHICRRVEQVSLTIKEGTKGGDLETRELPVAKWVADELVRYRGQSDFQQDSDFILCDDAGDWIKPRKMTYLHEEVLEIFGKRITPHQLRHSYGRLFVMLGGNMKVLQKLLGHSSMSTTELYSELSGSQTKGFGEVLSGIGVGLGNDE